jgi:hypothetical protein
VRHARFLAVAVTAGVLAGTPAWAQTDVIEFKLAFTKGGVSYLASTLSVEGNVLLLGNNIRIPPITSKSREVTRILDVESDGTFVVEIAVEDFQLELAGQTQQTLIEPTTLRVRADGKVVGLSDTEVFPFAFPDRAVGVGATWAHRSRMFVETGQQIDATITYRLAAIETGADGRLVRISTELAGTASGGSSVPLPAGIRMTPPKGTVRGMGEIVWAVDRSRVVQRSDTLVVQMESDITAEGQTAKITTTMRLVERGEAMSAEAAKRPVPSADQLIAPGRSIGPYAVDAAVADVTAQLGQHDAPKELPPLKAQRITWPNGLAGYLDPADQSKVVGLSTAVEQFATDKGIGFGSSEGAVLLAYGSPTAKIDVPLQVGSVRVLVYNEVGVAFAITADKAHAAAGGRHAPMGAVDWIDIFSPGGGAKIYPLP